MNTEILKVLKDLRSDLFYQLESKFGSKMASEYPSIVEVDRLIDKLNKIVAKKSTPLKEGWKKGNVKNSKQNRRLAPPPPPSSRKWREYGT